ncbi:P-type DNA transfer ATPase VirB11 [Herbaspirillum sp. ST 5-3]|uniref:P-type DNA transfer ATPase VirB11 n=1 Tax=Oxalobacteraceae TaxID=75682 RepID=UPI0010A489B9|nr:P-type DNA transfer ATPase VirB11 [Herbaspirillum sp. ST 5-3]
MSTITEPGLANRYEALSSEQVATAVALQRDASVRIFLEPFKEWIDDPAVTEIAVNSVGVVWTEKNSIWVKHACPAATNKVLRALGTAVATFSNQKWDATTPILSASMPDGSRIQLAMPPVVEEDRYSLTLRKPSRTTRTLDDFSASGLFKKVQPMKAALSSQEQELLNLLEAGDYEAFLRLAVRARMNIVVAGATGSGKTTFMKGLVQEIPRNERLITIEDVRELFLPHENCVHLLYSKGGQGKSNVKPKDLLESCLRMKPDRILLAELRGDECLYYVRNAASGHPGSITSCHAGSPALVFEQLAIMIQDSPGGANLTFDVIKRLLVLTIDVVVQFQNHMGERFISEIYFDPKRKLEAMK